MKKFDVTAGALTVTPHSSWCHQRAYTWYHLQHCHLGIAQFYSSYSFFTLITVSFPSSVNVSQTPSTFVILPQYCLMQIPSVDNFH